MAIDFRHYSDKNVYIYRRRRVITRPTCFVRYVHGIQNIFSFRSIWGRTNSDLDLEQRTDKRDGVYSPWYGWSLAVLPRASCNRPGTTATRPALRTAGPGLFGKPIGCKRRSQTALSYIRDTYLSSRSGDRAYLNPWLSVSMNFSMLHLDSPLDSQPLYAVYVICTRLKPCTAGWGTMIFFMTPPNESVASSLL